MNEKFDDIIYRPKTKENQLIYQSFLGRLNQIVEDHTHETLISMADEILALIRGEGVDL